jgi:site-specific DNA-methyltransferase (adenine-specific)
LKVGVLIQGDCLEKMQILEPNSVDMVLCDLPYGVTNRNKWDVIIPFDALWKCYNYIIKPGGAIVLTATQPFAAMLIASNYKNFRYDLIWEKHIGTGFLNANRMPLRTHESVLVFYDKLPTYNPQFTQGKPYTAKAGLKESTNYGANNRDYTIRNDDGKRFPGSVLKIKHDRSKLHPTQKPVELFEWLIKTYTNPGELILDNCAGSGTTGIAAMNTGRDFIIIERDENYFQTMCDRIKKHNLDMEDKKINNV